MSGHYFLAATSFDKISKLYDLRGDYISALDYENKSINSLKHYDIKLALEASYQLNKKLNNICTANEISFDLWCSTSNNIASIRLLNGLYNEAICMLQQISDTILNTKGLKHYRSQFLNSQFDICTAYEKSGHHLKSIQGLENLSMHLTTTQDKTSLNYS